VSAEFPQITREFDKYFCYCQVIFKLFYELSAVLSPAPVAAETSRIFNGLEAVAERLRNAQSGGRVILAEGSNG
jgi:hypothetical protein